MMKHLLSATLILLSTLSYAEEVPNTFSSGYRMHTSFRVFTLRDAPFLVDGGEALQSVKHRDGSGLAFTSMMDS